MLRRRKHHGLATRCGVSLTNIKPSMRRIWIPIRIVLRDNSAHNRFLQRILHFWWEDHVRTEELLERARKRLLFDNANLIWRWKIIGYILGQGCNSNWVPEGKRRRPKTTSRRTVGKKRKEAGWDSWAVVQVASAYITICSPCFYYDQDVSQSTQLFYWSHILLPTKLVL